MGHIMHYTVCFLFDTCGNVLLQRKDRTEFAEKLNGIGGRVDTEYGENPRDGAMRKIQNETGITPSILLWLGDLTLPDNCDPENEDACCCLHFFGGIDEHHAACQQENQTETLEWHPFAEIINHPERKDLAGDGDVWYFICRAARML